MNQNSNIDWQGGARFCINKLTASTLGITASCGTPTIKGFHHYLRWNGLTIQQARKLGENLIEAADEMEKIGKPRMAHDAATRIASDKRKEIRSDLV